MRKHCLIGALLFLIVSGTGLLGGDFIVPTVLTGTVGDLRVEFLVTLQNDSDEIATCSLVAFTNSGVAAPVDFLHFFNVPGAVGSNVPIAAGGIQVAPISPPEGIEFFSGWACISCDVGGIGVTAELTLADRVEGAAEQAGSNVKRGVVPIQIRPPGVQDRWLTQAVLLSGDDESAVRESAFAIVNPSDEPITVELLLSLPTEPGFGHSASIEIGPGSRVAKFIGEVFPLPQAVIPEPPPVTHHFFILTLESSSEFAASGIDVLFPEVRYAPGTRLP